MRPTPNSLPNHSLVESQESLVASFFESHPPERLSRNLRILLLEHLQCEGVTEALYLPDLLHDLAAFLELLDEIQLVQR